MDYIEIKVSDGHYGHRTTRINVEGGEGIKADFCVACQEVISYLFEGERWTQGNAETWVADNIQSTREREEMHSILNDLRGMVGWIADSLAALGLQRGKGEDVTQAALSLLTEQAAFGLQQPAVKEGVVVNDRGWIRKPIFRTGDWPEVPPGGDEPLKVTLAHLELIKAAFDEGAFERVCVPLGHGPGIDDMDYVTEHNKGYVMALEISPRDDGEYSLDAWIKFTDPEIEEKVRLGSIWNCSVLLVPDVVRPSDSRRFPLAIKHVALTNYPWIESLPGFVEASRDLRQHRQQAAETTEKVGDTDMDEKLKAQLARLVEAGLTVEEIEAMRQERAQVLSLQQDLQVQQAQLAREKRAAEIKTLVLALEGKHQMEGVTQLEGRRHYPAVVKAVGAALSQLPVEPTVSIQLSRDGQQVEETIDLQGLILGIANAIPAEGRVQLEQPSVPQPNNDPHTEETPDQASDEDVEALAGEIGLELT